MDECPCLIPGDDDNCIDCGKHMDIPNVDPPDLGDIGGIFRLIDSTAKNYVALIQNNIDPTHPSLPRLRMVGGMFVRIPNNMICKGLIGPSYLEAKKLGYRGTIDRWCEIITEATPTQQPNL